MPLSHTTPRGEAQGRVRTQRWKKSSAEQDRSALDIQKKKKTSNNGLIIWLPTEEGVVNREETHKRLGEMCAS